MYLQNLSNLTSVLMIDYKSIWDIFDDSFTDRSWKWFQKRSDKIFAAVQRDMAFLHFLAEKGSVDFSSCEGDSTKLEEIMKQEWIEEADYPQMAKEAMLAIKNDWKIPLAEDMQQAEDYFNNRARGIIRGK